MAYIVLTLTGWFLIQIAKIEWPTAKQVLFILVVLLVRLVGYLAVEFLVPKMIRVFPLRVLFTTDWRHINESIHNK